ncbi:MAG: DUF2806 domain-containing protein [Cyanobacteria bacterium MAG CAR3_bin_5]|nr:DUF2806 domain-containing protein [Cyanobacteria bacterium MAG CAR3_bin_5]
MAAINGHADGGRLKMTELNLVKVSGKVEVKVPAVEKLVDYVASGVGAIAGPMLAPWRASREGKARIITAETDAKFQQIQAAEEGSTLQLIAKVQAEARESVVPDKLEPDGSLRIGPSEIQNAMEFQAKKRLMNVGAIAGHAAEELKGKEVSDHDPDPDWIARFFDGAQDVSSEELQKLWGRILAGEVKSSGKTSLRTLSILKNMTQQEARDFSKLMRFRIGRQVFNNRTEKMLGENISQVVHFSHIGLFGSRGEIEIITLGDDGKWIVEHCGHNLIIEGLAGQTLEMLSMHFDRFIPHLITDAGLELAKMCQHKEPDFQYLSHFATCLAVQDCTLKLIKIADQKASSNQFSNIRIIEPFVEPEERDPKEEPTNAE